MYADVVVLTYQAPGIGTFTYEIPHSFKNLKVGQIVEVPFGQRSPQALVLDIKKSAPKGVEIRPIIRAVTKFPLLLPHQIELIKWMSDYYIAPIVNCLEAILPQIPKRMEKEETSDQRPVTIGQTLILLPTINKIPEALAQFPDTKNYVLYHNQQNATNRYKNYLKILSGKTETIFGSRSAIFAPCPNLKKIIIFDEHDSVYKDERSPYFDTLTVAEKIRELTKVKIKIIDSSPKITTIARFKKEISFPPAKKIETQIVSMVGEKKAGNKTPISETLEESIKQTIAKGGKVLLFLNKKIESGQVYCNNCKHQAFASQHPIQCPNCKSTDIFYYSLNLATLANHIKQITPNATIKLISEGIEPAHTKSQIHISTAAIFYSQILSSYELVCHVSVDHVLNIADLGSAENAYAQIANLKKLLKKGGLLILQTHNPESTIVTTAASGNLMEFARGQIEEKKSLNYPPYSLLVKLALKGKDVGKLEKNARTQFKALKEILDSDVSILGPYKPTFPGKIPKYNIILKTPISTYILKERQKTIEKMKKALNQIPKEWQIVVEPNSLN